MQHRSLPIAPFWPAAIAGAGCFGSGSLLAAFQASVPLWLSACGIVAYLVWSTTEALFLSNLWLLGLFARVVGLRPWPDAWQAFSAWKNPQLWALVLLGLWFYQVALLWGIAQASRQWQWLDDPHRATPRERLQRRQCCWSLTLLYCSALSGGFWLFSGLGGQ